MAAHNTFERISINRIIPEECSVPKNDLSQGSALYKVVIEISANPSQKWNEFFVDSWNRPPTWSPMHRPGIAYVTGNRIVLDGTTVDEVEKYHNKTLKLAVSKANEEHEKFLRKKHQEEIRSANEKEKHQAQLHDASKRLTFDDDDEGM